MVEESCIPHGRQELGRGRGRGWEKKYPSRAYPNDPLTSTRSHLLKFVPSPIISPAMNLSVDEVRDLMIQSLPKSPTYKHC